MYRALNFETARICPRIFWKADFVTDNFTKLLIIINNFYISSVPVTEVTTESLFSFLNIVFNKLRAKSNTDVLEDFFTL